MRAEDGWPEARRPSLSDDGSEVFGQLIRLPLTLGMFGMNLFSRTVRGVLDLAVQGVARADRRMQTFPAPAPPVAVPSEPFLPGPDRGQTDFGSSNLVDRNDSKSTSPGEYSSAAPNTPKEMTMADTNLSDDMLKLVSYSIVCIERGAEKVLLCQDCKIFGDNMTDCDFDSWVIADYCEHHDVPCEKKYLRVAYTVQGRWPKPDLQYEEKQLERLEGIEDAIRKRP